MKYLIASLDSMKFWKEYDFIFCATEFSLDKRAPTCCFYKFFEVLAGQCCVEDTFAWQHLWNSCFSCITGDLFSRWLKNQSITVSVDSGSGEICSFHSSLLITTATVIFLVFPPFFFWLVVMWMGLRPTLSSQRCWCSLQRSWTRWHLKVPSNLDHSMILCTLDCHNLFSLIFSTCFINVILPSEGSLNYSSRCAVGSSCSKCRLYWAGCHTYRLVCLCCCTLSYIKYDHQMDSCLECDCYLATREKNTWYAPVLLRIVW